MKHVSLTADQIYKLSKAGFCPQIKSVDGFTEIIDSYKKIGIGFLFQFQNGKELKVAINHKMFISGNWVEAKDLHIGDFINETDYVLSKIEVPSQEWIDFSVRDKSESYYHKDILHHNSGKSAILYYKIRWHIAQGNNILLIVPSTQLVSQMVGDFIDYSAGNGFDVGEHCQMLFAGKEKEFTKQVMIQTWQSLAAMAKSQKHLFQLIVDRTDVACFDECLDGDTLIEMPDGQKKKIKELKAGENVITRNEKTGKLENKPIVKVHNNITPHTEKMFRIKMTDGQEINITGNHNVFLEQGVWKRADELGVGDIINSM